MRNPSGSDRPRAASRRRSTGPSTWGRGLSVSLAICLAMALAAATAPAALWATESGTAGDAASPENRQLRVIASIPPLAYFAVRIGGERVTVQSLVAAGQDPHALSLKPSQAAAIQRADLIVLIGGGLEFWLEDLLEGNGSPDPAGVARVLRLAEAAAEIPKAAQPAEEPQHDASEHEHRHGAVPHPWLNPRTAQQMVTRMARAMGDLDPRHAMDYARRAEHLHADLAALDREIEQALTPLRGRTLVTVHAGYEAFAQRYGLNTLAVAAQGHGAEISAARMGRIVRFLRESNLRAVLGEAQLSPRTARILGEETGLPLQFLDPLGAHTGGDYLQAMRNNLRAILAALQ